MPRISRKQFLKYALLCGFPRLVGAANYDSRLLFGSGEGLEPTDHYATRDATPDERSDAAVHVLIIGAGMAGLAAANALSAARYRVTILEARARIGGRIWTDRSLGGLALDLGASWIHGSDNPTLPALARRYRATTITTDYDRLRLYDSDGRPLSAREQAATDTLFTTLMRSLSALGETLDTDIALQTGIDRWLRGQSLSRDARRRLDYAVNSIIEHEMAADSEDLSLWYFDEGAEIEGDDWLLPGGYDQLTDGLAAGLDIRLDQVVRQIRYDEQRVTVTTEPADASGERHFSADCVLVTVPLGVLKHGDIRFVPPLPAPKQRAIRRLGMGVLDKVYLRFPEVFWDEQSHLLGYVSEPKGMWSEWLNLYALTGEPVLLGFNAGRYGRALEELADDEIVRAGMGVLRTLYGAAIPAPTGYLISRWGRDPFARGAYSYWATGSEPADRAALARPVGQQLFFAGEATDEAHAATVHGAYLSGRRAAREIGRAW